MHTLIHCEIGEVSGNTQEVLLIPEGHFRINPTVNGKAADIVLNITPDQLSKVASETAVDGLYGDYNHDNKDACGWVRRLAYVAGKGLSAIVEFTNTAVEKIKEGAYKYISPSLYIDDNNQIVSFANPAFGLVNNPAFDELREYPVQFSKAKMYMDPTKEETKAECAVPVPLFTPEQIAAIQEIAKACMQPEDTEDMAEMKKSQAECKASIETINSALTKIEAQKADDASKRLSTNLNTALSRAAQVMKMQAERNLSVDEAWLTLKKENPALFVVR